MPGWTEQLRHSIDTLVRACDDAEDGFRRASATVAAADTRALLLQWSAERRQFAAVLRSEMRRAGEDAEVARYGLGSPAWASLEQAREMNTR